MGFEPIILNFIDYVYSPECMVVKNVDCLWLRRLFYRFRIYVKGLHHHRVVSIEKFIQDNVRMTEPCFSDSQITEALKNIDVFVVGSDTCWYPASTDWFTLNKAADDNIKIAYAPSSLNSNLHSGFRFWTEKCKGISRMTSVSVREEIIGSIIEKLTGNLHPSVVLDPVFLLSREYWNRFCSEKKNGHPYMLLYLMGSSDFHLHIIKRLQKEYHLNIILIRNMENIHKAYHFDAEERDATIEEFVTLVRDAGIVITDSFHGIAFSIIFRKDFYVLRRDNSQNLFGRLKHLLRLFSLEDRLVVPYHPYYKKESINYDKVDVAYHIVRERSIHFLTKALYERSSPTIGGE
jgi:hypothetical protein